MSEVLDFDPNDLTLQEMCDFEEATGQLASEVFGEDEEGNIKKPSTRMLAGVVWLMKRRANPDLTFHDIVSMRMGDLTAETADAPGG